MAKPLMSKTQNICLVLLCILFILLACIMVRELLAKREEKEPDYKIVEIDDDMVSKAMTNWDLTLCNELDDYVKNIFKNNKVTNISNEDKLYMVLKENLNFEKLTLEEINSKLKNIITTEDLTNKDIVAAINSSSLNKYFQFNLNGDELSFATFSSSTCDASEHLISKVMSAEENGMYLKVYLKVAFGKDITNDEGNKMMDYYKDINYQKFVERVSKEDYKKIDLNKFDTHIFKFKIDGKKYLLESVNNEK